MGLFLHKTKFQFYLTSLSCYTGLRAKMPYCLRYNQLEVGRVTMYDKG